MIIGLSGKAGSGKDTVARILVEEFGYKRVAFGDKIKECLLALDPIVWNEIASQIFSNVPPRNVRLSELVKLITWDEAKQYPEVRRLLQRMGTEVGREIFGEDFWVEIALKDFNENENFVVTDVRFPNEFYSIRSAGKLWRIERDVPAVNSHSSETELDGWEFDEVIENNGSLEDLKLKVREVMK